MGEQTKSVPAFVHQCSGDGPLVPRQKRWLLQGFGAADLAVQRPEVPSSWQFQVSNQPLFAGKFETAIGHISFAERSDFVCSWEEPNPCSRPNDTMRNPTPSTRQQKRSSKRPCSNGNQ